MFKQKDLRNTNRPLLRRLQRQIESDFKKKKNNDKKEEIISFKTMSNGFVQESPTVLDLDEKFLLKKTRLNLYNRRRGR